VVVVVAGWVLKVAVAARQLLRHPYYLVAITLLLLAVVVFQWVKELEQALLYLGTEDWLVLSAMLAKVVDILEYLLAQYHKLMR
jgi:hypothetical protein